MAACFGRHLLCLLHMSYTIQFMCMGISKAFIKVVDSQNEFGLITSFAFLILGKVVF